MRGMRLLTGTIALLLGGFASLHAQDPSARVARASYLQGDVSFRPGSANDWTSATLNYPLTTGDHLWTDANARAELHVGSSAIRLGPQTAFEILSLDDNNLRIRLTQGTALLRLRTLANDDNIEIDTPTGAVSLLRAGSYRVDVSTDGATSSVTVRNGDAEVSSNGSTVSVRSDETVLFTADGASRDARAAAPMDEYDLWAVARDRSENRSFSARYVSRDMTGYEDLDDNGSWSDDPEYGHVWVPTHVVAGWAPYRYGRWVWVEPWGWTWIDDAPWGFAPFHYGRWAYVRDRWAWAPGFIVARPVYAPALVAFVGGSHFSVSLAFGSGGGVAWFPLAPGEAYRPAYRVSDRYVRNVNVTNVNVTNINVTNVNVTNIQYRNQRVAGAVTAVPREAFVDSRSIGRRAVVVPQHDAVSARVVGDGAPVAPAQQSLIGRRIATNVSRPPDAAAPRQAVSSNAPPRRMDASRPMSHTDGPSPVNGSANAGPAHTVAPRTIVRSAVPVRPNVNVQPYPRQRPNMSQQPNAGIRPNVNVRAYPAEQPTATPRRAPQAPQAPQPPQPSRVAPPRQPMEPAMQPRRQTTEQPRVDNRRAPRVQETAKPQHDTRTRQPPG